MTQITSVCDLGHSRKAKPNGICIHLAITCNEIAAAEIQNQQEIEMQKRQLGNSDLQITPVGYGAWAIGGSGWQFAWSSQSDNDSIAAIHRALELGVNWIDTAAVYGLGHSEEVVARALKEWSGPRPYVFTKCGLRWDAKGEVSKVLRSDSIRREVEDSLRRLKLDVIDLYQIHWPPDPDSPELEEGWRWTVRNPAVTGAIVGARNARQANGVMRAGELRLSDKEVNEIEEIADEIAA